MRSQVICRVEETTVEKTHTKQSALCIILHGLRSNHQMLQRRQHKNPIGRPILVHETHTAGDTTVEHAGRHDLHGDGAVEGAVEGDGGPAHALLDVLVTDERELDGAVAVEGDPDEGFLAVERHGEEDARVRWCTEGFWSVGWFGSERERC